MRLSRYETTDGARWALDGRWLRADFSLSDALAERANVLPAYLDAATTEMLVDAAASELLAPVESGQEVWACGVTYQRSHDARVVESQVRDVYTAVYQADRPEIFFKSTGWRVRAHHQPVRLRGDSQWNVPEAELVLVVNVHAEIVGYTAEATAGASR